VRWPGVSAGTRGPESRPNPAALGVDLVVLDQAIDTTTPRGRLLFHVLASISEFERDLIRDRVLAGLKRAKAQGVRLGRPRAAVDVLRARGMLADGKSLRQVAKALRVALATLARAVPKTSSHGTRASVREMAGAGALR